MFAPCRYEVTRSPLWSMVRRKHLDFLAIMMDLSWLAPYYWSLSRIVSIHVCPRCMGIWMSMDLEQGCPRIRSLWGKVCLFMNQGVCRFMQWFMTVTWSLDVKMGLTRFTSLCPPRIWFPSLQKASPPS